MNMNFEAGQTVYSEHGEQAEYVTKAGDGHIVRPIVEVDDDDGSYDEVCDPVVWRKAFPAAPVAKFSTELATLHEQIAAAKSERSKLESEDWQRQRERAEKLKRFAILDNLEAFIDGKITHYVEHSAPPAIIPVAQAVASESSNWRKELRLLTLGGSLSSGDVKWTLNRYSDGSGGAGSVTPCTSYEQAVEVVKAAVVQHFKGDRPDYEKRQDWINVAEKLEIPVPEAYRHAVVKNRIRAIEQNSGYQHKQAKEYADAVAKTEAELAQLRACLEASAGAA